MIELAKQEKMPMIRHILSSASGLAISLLGLGLVVGLVILIYSGQPNHVSFGASVNVAATAQAIQAHNRQAELESTLAMKQVAWELELIKKQQEILAEFNSAAQQQLTDLQTKFLNLQSELNQIKLTIQTDQFKAKELQNAIQADAAELTNLEEQVKQLTNDLDQTKTRLQAATETLARQQAVAQPLELTASPQASPNSDDKPPAATSSSDDGHGSESAAHKEGDSSDHHDSDGNGDDEGAGHD